MFNVLGIEMNNIKNTFKIKDLENLTGIKAHTIRIWEKRYNLLKPLRSETNIRHYDLSSFQKLLNITYLNKNGYKISKIATLSDKEIINLVREIAEKYSLNDHAINAFKISMLNFDQVLFYKTYESLLSEKKFQDIFYDIFIPLLTEIGLLWQTNTITPAHEHFLTTLIRKKILINTEKIQSKGIVESKKTFVLYLPDNEIHELGIMFINYQIVLNGYQSIFLGLSTPIESLKDIKKFYDDIVFLSYFTVKPEKSEINSYLDSFYKELLKDSENELWVLGYMVNSINTGDLKPKIKIFKNIESVIKKIKKNDV